MKPPPHLRRDWGRFVGAVGKRLAAGHAAYGGRSERASPARLAREVEQELLDVMGWGFLCWRQVRTLRRRAAIGRPTRRGRR